MLRSSWAPGASCPVLSCQCEEILRSSGKQEQPPLLVSFALIQSKIKALRFPIREAEPVCAKESVKLFGEAL